MTCLARGFTATEETAGSPTPAWLWSTSDRVAKAAVDGLLRGRPLVVPGLPWRTVAVLGPRLPRWLVRQLARKLGRRMIERARTSRR